MFVTTSFEEQLMREIDSVAKLNRIKQFSLGGIDGPSGGGGAPIGGFIGKLAQRYVTFDTDEFASSAIPSGPSLLTNLNRIRSGVSLGNNSILQRHILSGVGTITLDDGSLQLYPVSKLRFLNGVITGTPDDAQVEIMLTSSGYYSLPDMTGHEGEYLTNNGVFPTWGQPLGTVSSVFARTGDVVATSGDYDHNQLSNHGLYSHALIDGHIESLLLHLPNPTGFPGAFVVTDGISYSLVVPSGFGHFIQDHGIGVSARSNLNFTGSVVITDDPTNDATVVDISGTATLLATVPESNAGVLTDRAVTPAGLPLRVENAALINNQDYGGNTRGQSAVDLQNVRTNASQVAAGDYSAILGGTDNQADGEYAVVAGGQGNQILLGSANTIGGGALNTIGSSPTGYSVIAGGTDNLISSDYAVIAGGQSNNVSEDYAWANGHEASAVNHGQVVSASGSFSTVGDAQGTIQLVLRREVDFSVDTGWQSLYLDGVSVLMSTVSGSMWTIHGLVSAATQGLSNRASYEILAAVSNIGGTVTIDSQSITPIYETNTDWDIRLNGSGSNLLLEVTDGTDTETVRWVGALRITELNNFS